LRGSAPKAGLRQASRQHKIPSPAADTTELPRDSRRTAKRLTSRSIQRGTWGSRQAFHGNRGEFFHQETLRNRVILVRYVWLNISPKSSRMEQSFSPDGGDTWEVNWICELSR